MTCRICNGTALFYDNVDFLQPVKYTNKPFKLKKYKAPIYLCSSCKFLMIMPLLPDNHYEADFIFSETHSGLEQIRLNQLNKLLALSDDNNSCLEIGCGDGVTFPVSAALFQNLTAIEPSLNQYNIALQRAKDLKFKGYNINVINSNLKNLNLNYYNFSSFYSIMVFEHLIDPIDSLINIKKFLKPGATGFINVPNGQALYNNGYLPMFPCEHINYFTPLSLAKILQDQGFEIIDISTSQNNKINLYDLSAYFRLPTQSTRKFSESKIDAKNKLSFLLKNKKNVTVWGAGNNAHHYGDLLNNTYNVKNIIDSSPPKVDSYINNLNIRVRGIDYSIIKNSDAILIFASSFNKEIVFALRNDYDYKGLIVGFQDGNVVSFNLQGVPIF